MNEHKEVLRKYFRILFYTQIAYMGITCINAITHWDTDYQEYHGHSEIAAQWDEKLAKKWRNLFVWEVVIALVTSVFSVFGTVILVATEMLTDTITTVIIALTTGIGLVLEGLYLLYMKRTLALIEA